MFLWCISERIRLKRDIFARIYILNQYVKDRVRNSPRMFACCALFDVLFLYTIHYFSNSSLGSIVADYSIIYFSVPDNLASLLI